MAIIVAGKTYIESTGSAVSPSYQKEFRDVYTFPEYADPRRYEYLSRYTPYRQIIGSDNQKFLETFNNTEIINSEEDQYYTVEVRTENRLDIIAAEHYGFPNYWWIVAHANGIIDPFNVPYGTVLRIPPVKSLYLSEGVINNV